MEVPGCEPQGRLPWVAVPQEAGVNQTVIQTVIKSDNGPPRHCGPQGAHRTGNTGRRQSPWENWGAKWILGAAGLRGSWVGVPSQVRVGGHVLAAGTGDSANAFHRVEFRDS